ncbi:MAG TPA: AAA family ATPase, partial [Terriglobales bacterium]|nr:AAA family ATPase [Terriglobales bacterium]
MSEQNGSTPPLTVVGLEVEAVKRLRSVKIIPPATGGVKIAGRNGQGKSSTLDAIEMALRGKKYDPTKPIHDGAKKGSVTIDLADAEGRKVLVVERRWTETNSYLDVTDAVTGRPVKSPQDFLNRLVGAGVAFDPLSFITKRRGEQVSMLLDALKLPEDPRELDRERKRVYDDRTAVNRELDKATLQLEGAMDPGPDVPDEEVSIADLTAEHARLTAQQQARAEKEQAVAAARGERDRWAGEIARLRRELETAEREHEGAKAKVLRLELERDKLPEPDFATVTRQLEAAEQTNAAVRMKREHTALVANQAALAEQAMALTAQIAEIDERKRKLLEGAAFPVAGLGFEEVNGE